MPEQHQHLQHLLDSHPTLAGQLPRIRQAADALISCYRRGGKLLVCGNGGSCADADHITGELHKGFLRTRPLGKELAAAISALDPALEQADVAGRLQQGLPAVNLGAHAALLTATANDLGADLVFAQQVTGLGRSGDVFMGISTSGNADNVYKAMAVAKAMGLVAVALTGGDGGVMAGLADVAIVAPARHTPAIQEYHLAIYHALCAQVEETLFPV